MPLAEDVSLESLSQQTHGFVGADLAALAREAAIRALRRYLPDLDLDKAEIDQETLDKLRVYASDFRSAQRDVGPSAMREVMLEVSHVKWTTVGGLDAAKTEVREAVEYPLTHHDRFEDLGIEPPRGVLLYGPPGTGKTLIAKAVASESGANFIPVRARNCSPNGLARVNVRCGRSSGRPARYRHRLFSLTRLMPLLQREGHRAIHM